MSDIAIPRSEFRRARRIMCRRVASLMVLAMADTDTDFSLIDTRCGFRSGRAHKLFNRLASGRSIHLDTVAVLFWSMGASLTFELEKP